MAVFVMEQHKIKFLQQMPQVLSISKYDPRFDKIPSNHILLKKSMETVFT